MVKAASTVPGRIRWLAASSALGISPSSRLSMTYMPVTVAGAVKALLRRPGPETVSACKKKYNTSRANQKLGMLTPVTDMARTVWSRMLLRRMADIMPNSTPLKWRQSQWQTKPVQWWPGNTWPAPTAPVCLCAWKFPGQTVKRFFMYRIYCTGRGWSRPYFAR